MSGFRSVSGYARAAEIAGRHPHLEPYRFTPGQVLITAGLPGAPTVATADLRVPGGADIYCLGASIEGHDTNAPETFTGMGAHGDAVSPEAWYATAEMSEDVGGVRYVSGPVRAGHLYGRGELPCWFPVPLVLKGGTTLRLGFSHQDVTAMSFWPVFHGFKRIHDGPALGVDVLLTPRLLHLLRAYRDAGRLGRVEPFWYALNFTGTLGLRTEQRSFTVAAADFVCLDLMGAVTDPNNEAFFSPSDILVRLNIDQGRTRLEERPVPLANLFGSGRRPFQLARPLVLRRGQTLTAIVTQQQRSTAAQGQWDIFLTFAGVRIFDPERPQ